MSDTPRTPGFLSQIIECQQMIAELHKPDDIVRLYMSRETAESIPQRIGNTTPLDWFIGTPVHFDESLPFGTVNGDQRDGTRRTLLPEGSPYDELRAIIEEHTP